MTLEQRLNTVETDLETAKQLLVSAANYAESVFEDEGRVIPLEEMPKIEEILGMPAKAGR